MNRPRPAPFSTRFFFLPSMQFANQCPVSKSGFIIGVLLCVWLVQIASADTFKLTTGETIVGEVLPTTANDQGVQVKTGEGEYQRVPWGNFAQDDLKKLAQYPKAEPFVAPYIEISPEEKRKNTEVNLKAPPRLERPAPQSMPGALFSSGLGLLIVLTLYGANICAGYEIARFRSRPLPLVCGVSAALPLIGPVLFLALPTKGTKRRAEQIEEAPAESTSAPAHAAPANAAPSAAPPTADSTEAVNPMQGSGVEPPPSVHLARTETEHVAKPAPPKPTIYLRGQFTFNRRFFETKFPGFFGVVRKGADRDLVLVIKSARGQYVGQRISRIAANDLHLQVQRGPASEEVMIPFQEIQEIRLQRQDD
jgi:hypothetical protein